ncbi:MAG: DUF1292 domain-containing protein [Oscillospiraceae bacterium]|jgi:uncharacterized protein YrzB (UPF0473 family)|nr:DUF1292 domain-containing protein [Oscillospiraceae bacterium]
MNDEYGGNIYTVTDEDGNEISLEHLDTIELDGGEYMAFVPADMDDTDPDYGIVLLRVEEEGGMGIFATIDDADELERVHDAFMQQLFADEDDEE